MVWLASFRKWHFKYLLAYSSADILNYFKLLLYSIFMYFWVTNTISTGADQQSSAGVGSTVGVGLGLAKRVAAVERS